MGRNIGGALAGYVVMFVVVVVGMTGAWLALGPDGAFEPGTWDVSPLWGILSVLIGLAAAVAGGFVCAKVGADRKAVYMLVGLVIVLGVLSAIPDAGAGGGTRPDGISMWDAMGSALQPAWARWSNPVLGVVGALWGASRVNGAAPAPIRSGG